MRQVMNVEKFKRGLNLIGKGSKKIVTDLFHLKWYEYAFLAVSTIFLTMTSFYDLVGHAWVWEGKETWKAALGVLSGLAAWTGIVCVFLVGKGKPSNYFYGAINNVLYGLYAFSVAYTGDAILNLFVFLPLEFIGFFMWMKSLNKKEEVKENKFGWKEASIFAIIAGVLWVFFWFTIPVIDEFLNIKVLKTGDSSYTYWFTDMPIPHAFDALTNALSVVAIILMVRAHKEQWYVWGVVNVFQIAMYAGVNGMDANLPMIFMWTIFLINAAYSLFLWIKREKEQKKNEIKETK